MVIISWPCNLSPDIPVFKLILDHRLYNNVAGMDVDLFCVKLHGGQTLW